MVDFHGSSSVWRRRSAKVKTSARPRHVGVLLAALLAVLFCWSADGLVSQSRGSFHGPPPHQTSPLVLQNSSAPQITSWRSRAHAALDASGNAHIETNLGGFPHPANHDKSGAIEAQEAENLARDAQHKLEFASSMLALGHGGSPENHGRQSKDSGGSGGTNLLRENVQLRLQATKLSAELEKLRDEDAQLRREDSQLRVEDGQLRRAFFNSVGKQKSWEIASSTPAMELLDGSFHWNTNTTDSSLTIAYRRPHRHLKELLIGGSFALAALVVCLWSSGAVVDEDSDSDDEEAEAKLLHMLGKQKKQRRWCCGCCSLCMNGQVALFCGGTTIVTILLGAVMWQMGLLQPILAQFTVYTYVIVLVVLFLMVLISEMWRAFRTLMSFVITESRRMKAFFSGGFGKVPGAVKDFLDDGRLSRPTVPAFARRMPPTGGAATKIPVNPSTSGLGSFGSNSAPGGLALREGQGTFPKRAGPRLV